MRADLAAAWLPQLAPDIRIDDIAERRKVDVLDESAVLAGQDHHLVVAASTDPGDPE